MPVSRSPTPLYGYDKTGRPVTRAQARPKDQPPPANPPTQSVLQRRPAVSGDKPTVQKTRTVVSTSSGEGTYQPTTSSPHPSLDWDANPSLSRLSDDLNDDPLNLNRWTTSTQFSVAVDTFVNSEESDELDEEPNLLEITDDLFEPPADQPSSGTSQNTVKNMADDNQQGGHHAQPEDEDDFLEATVDLNSVKIVGTAAAKKAYRNIKKAVMSWEDDFRDSDPTQMIKDRLSARLEKAEEMKALLAEAILDLGETEPEGWDDTVEAAANQLKKKYVGFIRIADSQLHGLSNAVNSDPVVQVKANRVRKRNPVIINDMHVLEAELASCVDVTANTPTDVNSLMLHQETCAALREKAKDLADEARRLVTDATEAALADEAELIENGLQSLLIADRDLVTKLAERKGACGLVTGAAPAQKCDVPLPKFSGNIAENDYYTFLTDWQQYISAKVMNEPERVRLLKRSCLSGQAQTMTKKFTTVPDVLEHLKKAFGNPLLLFNAKIEELRKQGTCTGSDFKKREWMVDVKARMDDLELLSVQHGLTEKLYNSVVASEVQNSLSYAALKEFKKIVKKENVQGNVSAEFFWQSLSSHLDTCIDNITFDINFALNASHGRKSNPDSGNASKNHSNKGVGQKAFLADSSTPESGGKNERKGEKRQKEKGEKKPKKNAKATETFSTVQVNIPANYVEPALVTCTICSNQHAFCFHCPNFQDARGKDRIGVAAKMRACFRCLRSDSQIDLKNREAWWQKHEPHCKTTWVCAFGDCPKAEPKRQYHMLMCLRHEDENKEKQRAFIQDMDQKFVKPGMNFFFNYSFYQLDSQPAQPPSTDPNVLDDLLDPTIFLLQYVEYGGEVLFVFYDSGCAGAALNNRAALALQSKCLREGPTTLSVAGGITMEIDGGDESFQLQLADSDQKATLTGLKMPSITQEFPTWQAGAAWKLISEDLDANFPDHGHVQPPPDIVGGAVVDIMIGVRYNKYFPRLLYMLPSGLGIYESQLESHEGNRCVLGGPHPSWRKFKDAIEYCSPNTFFTAEFRAYKHSCSTIHHVFSPGPVTDESRITELAENDEPDLDQDHDPDEDYHDVEVNELHHKGLDPWDLCDVNLFEPEIEAEVITPDCEFIHCQLHRENTDRWIIPSDWNVENTIYSLREDTNRFLGGELCGSTIEYRCLKCRNCHECKKSENLEAKSLKEEMEQSLIESCITFNPQEKRLVSKLPFLLPPKDCLLPNRYTAEKIFQSQLNRINSSEDMKLDVLASFNKLASRGYLVPISSLDMDTQKLVLDDKDAGHFIPWRTVFKENSLSTPCRIVYDASSRTPGGTSLNDILAKGENKLASIYNILIRFRCGKSAFCCDIRLAYNQIGLDPDHYRYQKFLWKDELCPDAPTEVYIIRTLIYGVKPVGNSLMAGFEKLSQYCMDTYPQHRAGAETLRNSAYVDDVAKASNSPDESRKTAQSLDFVLGLASMEVKGYTFSHQPPPPEVSSDGETVGVVGLVWSPLQDKLSLDIKKLFFGKIKRGKIPELVQGDVKESLQKNFTRRNLLGKVASVFDPIGLTTPITSKLKLDLHVLSDLKLTWDEAIPDTYLDLWVKNLQDIQSLRSIEFERSIIPMDATDNDVELIVSSDASQHIAICCVHARVRREDGSYSCRLVTAKSKLVRELTVPKGELRAATMACHVAHTVKHNLGDMHKKTMYVTDSSIALFWINSDSRPLETSVRNCVIDIRRFSSPSQWYHVESALNLADLGTRETTVEEIEGSKAWQTGLDWMKMDKKNMPVKSTEDIKMSQEERRLAGREIKADDINFAFPFDTDKVTQRYKDSKYLHDPNKYGWVRAVRVMSLIIKFVRRVVKRYKPVWEPPVQIPGPAVMMWKNKVMLTTKDLQYGERYYFRMATLEVKQNVPAKNLVDTDERGGILFYIGRILDGQEVVTPVDTMFDVGPLMFVKPVVERHSPVAYSIMKHVHEKVVFHRSASSTLRESRGIAYILRGRDLATEIKQACRSCKKYRAKLVETELGKLDDSRLTISPPFFYVQADLFGPILARCQHNHRSVVKCWAAVFKDPASLAVSVHAMSGYSTDHFLAAYTRFSSRYGHPNRIMIDAGSQLIKACKDMEISIVDLTAQLSTKHGVGVSYSTCPVGGHNVQGVVERSIKSVQDLFKRVFEGLKMDVLALETAFCWMSAQLNDLPISLGNRTEDLDSVDVITPSRLLLGRSSTRAAGGYARISPPSALVERMDEVYRAWWTIWEKEKLADYIPQLPKWKHSDTQVQEGDIVMILKNSDEVKLGDPMWRLARVKEVETSHRDGLVRVVTCEYRNSTETEFRTTRRSVRKLAVIYTEAELDISQELHIASCKADINFMVKNLSESSREEYYNDLSEPSPEEDNE